MTTTRRSIRTTVLAGCLAVGALAVPMAIAGPAGAATSGVTPSETSARCTKGSWPAAAAGRPEQLRAGAEAGVYVWHEADGWRLAVTHPGKARMTFNARIAVDTKLAAVEKLTEKPDLVWTRRQRAALDVRFTNYGQIDAVRVVTDCAGRLVVDASIDGVRVTPDQVFVGAEGVHPDAVPMIAVRR